MKAFTTGHFLLNSSTEKIFLEAEGKRKAGALSP